MEKDDIIKALNTVYDPELPVSIVELALIYDIAIDGNMVKVQMTLTNPGCPVAGSFPQEVRDAILKVEGVSDATVELVWDPPWDPSRLSEETRLKLGMY